MRSTTRFTRRFGKLAFVCFFAFCLSRAAHAVDREETITKLHHTAWRVEDGAPERIQSMAQTADGYLWLQAQNGLYRFDGVRFELIDKLWGVDLSLGRIDAVFAPRSGGLWVGYLDGGVVFLKDGHAESFHEESGLLKGTVGSIIEGLDGETWVGVSTGLFRIKDHRLIQIKTDWGYPDRAPVSLFVDRSGTLWVKTADGILLFLTRGSHHFEKSISGSDDSRQFSNNYLGQSTNGTVWESGFYGLRRLLQGKDDARARSIAWLSTPGAAQEANFSKSTKPISLLGNRNTSEALLVDHLGSFWITGETGLLRIAYPDQLGRVGVSLSKFSIEHFGKKEGLTSDGVLCVFEDRQGNIWVGTTGGLDGFRSNRVVRSDIPSKEDDQFALAPGNDGAIWAGNYSTPLMKIRDSVIAFPKMMGVRCLRRDKRGVIWLGGDGALWRLDGQRFSRVPLPKSRTQQSVIGIATDRFGSVWVSIYQDGVYRLTGGIWTRENERLGFPSAPAFVLDTDDNSRIWVGYGPKLVIVDGDRLTSYSKASGLLTGYMGVSYLHHEHLWLGAQLGVGLFENGHFRVLRGENGEHFQFAKGIVETENGDLWLSGENWIKRISCDELQKAAVDSSYLVRFDTLSAADGLIGSADQWFRIPTAIQDSSGKLWFSTNKGVFHVDPGKLQPKRRSQESLTSIVSIRVPNVTYSVLQSIGSPTLHLASNTHDVEIDYSSLDLSMAERNRFRYRLEGAGEDWVDAGTRRQAFFTNLPAGNYTFRVIASGMDGTWEDAGTMISFKIAPSYYQTTWFRFLIIVVALCCVWLVFTLRLRHATAMIQSRLSDRMMERERIARDLHDTLLQGFHGLMLRFQVASSLVQPKDPAYPVIEDALNRADRLMIESRERIRDLRYESEQVVQLADALEAAAKQMASDHTMSFRLTVEGAVRALNPLVRDEIYLVGREGLWNAFKHSNGTEVEAELTFHPHWVRLRVRDNGDGIEPETLRAGGAAGHWGISGMHERAEKIGAQFKMWNREGAGCELEVKLPSALAYQAMPKQSPWKHIKSKFLSFRIGSSENPESSES
jgi:ligand-binding sensor domain-containing protein/two-component sensor histidine kinase